MLERVRGRDGDEQRARVGVADVLGGEDHHSPGEEARILAGFEHRGQVVERGVGVRSPHRLDERRREVVVGVAALVVDERPLARRVLDVALARPATSSARALWTASSRMFSAARASPPARFGDQRLTSSGRSSASSSDAPRRTTVSTSSSCEGLELVDLHAREQRRVHLEVRVLGGRADQRDEALLDRR